MLFRWDDYYVDKDDKDRGENWTMECAVERRYEDANKEGVCLYVVILKFDAPNDTNIDLFSMTPLGGRSNS